MKLNSHTMNKLDLRDYVIESEGVWNIPYIDSDILGYYQNGFEPKYCGGHMGILPIDNDNVVILGEDDDHYFDIFKCSVSDLSVLSDILKTISNEISVKIDYLRATSKQYYTHSKNYFFTTNFSKGIFTVSMEDRGDISPLVNINIVDIKKVFTFDVSLSRDKYEVINSFLKRI
jgi:hypothetical protein